MPQTTLIPTREEALAQREWFVVDAADRSLGRVATQVAELLRGKGKPTFTPHLDCGDFVIVLNASRIRLSGNKATDKLYHRHTDYPGGIRTVTAGKLRDDRPDRLVRLAVQGMLPKNRLSRRLITKLKVYGGEEHPHGAQQARVVAPRD